MKKYSRPETDIIAVFADGVECNAISGSLELPDDELEN